MLFKSRLQAAVQDVFVAAVDAVMKESGWSAHGGMMGHYSSPEWQQSLPGPGYCTGDITIEAAGVQPFGDSTPPSQQVPGGDYTWESTVVVNPYADIYLPWRTKIEEAFSGWDSLPEVSYFDEPIKQIRQAVVHLNQQPEDASPGEGSPDLPSNPDLAASIDVVRRWTSPNTPGAWTGDLIYTFDAAYGSRLSPVISNQASIAVVLWIGLQGGRNIIQGAQDDLLDLARTAAKSFENPTSTTVRFAATGRALTDLVATVLPPQLKAVYAVGRGLAEVVGSLQPPPPPKSSTETELTGSNPEEIFGSLLDAIRALNALVCESELDLATTTFDGMHELIQTSSRSIYHISPGKGLDPAFAKAQDINVDASHLKEVGYGALPAIAAELLRSGQCSAAADSSAIWSRDASIGMGPTGPYPGWKAVHIEFDKLTTSSAAELVLAGENLAEGAGFLTDSDDLAATALKGLEDLIEDAPLDYQRPVDYVPKVAGGYSGLPGDANGDGAVTPDDGGVVIKKDVNGDGVLDGGDASAPKDVNGDGAINSLDRLAGGLVGQD